MKNNFNIIITGVGGQGLITLVGIIAEAALIEGYDVKSSELHGLSQRGGNVEVYIRFGKKVYSPLFSRGQADLLIGLEILEGLRGSVFAGPETNFLINKYSLPFVGGLPEKEVIEKLNKILNKRLYLISASSFCKEKLGKEVLGGTYILGYGVYNNLIPLKPESVLGAISKVIPEKYLEINKEAFNLANIRPVA
ncbi:MAG: indolepyruvate ferredoxin oxidoreductase, beta subunit [Parcubacteria group bacterium Licking1014_1]|nr:MAG: indolepyruvate ferredoxin oxidoreductase, beta subunit [Parcubacteria group bacterium Licking1014_1]